MTESNVTVPTSPTVSAVVNGPSMTTMYIDGIPVQVPTEHVGEMQARGALLYGADDLAAMPSELDALFDEAKACAHRFVDGVLANRQIDPSEDAESFALQRVMTRIAGRVNEMVTVAHVSFPVTPGTETDEERLDRLARDVQYHGWGLEEVKNRYGLTQEEAQAVLDRPIPALEMMAEPHAQMVDETGQIVDEWVPLSRVPDEHKERIVSIITHRVPEGEA